MPRPKVDLSAWQNDIKQRITQGQSQHDILLWLAKEGIKVSRGTLRAILRLWGTESDRSRLRTSRQDSSLPIAIHNLWSQQQLDDTQIVETLTARGIALSTRQVRDIRLEHKWHRRNDNPEVQEASFLLVKHACWEAIIIGPARSYGRNLMHWYLKT